VPDGTEALTKKFLTKRWAIGWAVSNGDADARGCDVRSREQVQRKVQRYSVEFELKTVKRGG